MLADFLGALVGASFPHIEKYGLDFAMVAAFIAIVVPQIKKPGCTVAAVVAAVSGVLLVVLPYSLGIVVASSAWRPRRPVRRPGGRAQADGKNRIRYAEWRRWKMSNSYFIALTLGMAAVTFLIRFSFIGLAGKIRCPSG
ncbi:AzlC family protein [Klebsiella pneumoniae subsp. ozaenae]|uniref:AzlC family protein n=1 Tax=Klebsiella pneumoniae subsp. ozaenae TaxID=574 RepID=A0A378B665_KLEPO|nr:AzlC family protein [Klebsiella pneumoniae subsp. ozaenae]